MFLRVLSDVITKIYKVFFGYKYFFPAEYDILILFKPTKSYNGLKSPEGMIRLRAQLQGPLTQQQKKESEARVQLRPADERA